jgi:hypothetical protein
MRKTRDVLSIREVTVLGDTAIPAGTPGTVEKFTLFGTPKRVRFVLHNDAGDHEVIAEVDRGDVA